MAVGKTGSGQGRVRSMSSGRMVQCSGHIDNNDPLTIHSCARHARLMRGFGPNAHWQCGEPKPLVQKHARIGQQKQQKSKT